MGIPEASSKVRPPASSGTSTTPLVTRTTTASTRRSSSPTPISRSSPWICSGSSLLTWAKTDGRLSRISTTSTSAGGGSPSPRKIRTIRAPGATQTTRAPGTSTPGRSLSGRCRPWSGSTSTTGSGRSAITSSTTTTKRPTARTTRWARPPCSTCRPGWRSKDWPPPTTTGTGSTCPPERSTPSPSELRSTTTRATSTFN